MIRWYACWVRIEEFHEVQKGGLSVDGCQAQTVGRLAALAAVPRAWLEVLSV